MFPIADPTAVFTLCVITCAFIYWSGKQPWASGFYKAIPPIVLVCYIPATAATLDIIPSQSPAYVWMSKYLLPFSLFLLMVTADIGSVLRVGRIAAGMMFFSTVGVVIGAPVAFLICKQWLPPDSWKAVSAIAGAWIGGPANFAALKESVQAPDNLVGPALIVDTAVSFTWLSVLLFLSNYQRILNRFFGDPPEVLPDTASESDVQSIMIQRTPDLAEILLLLAVGFGGAVACNHLAMAIDGILAPIINRISPSLASIFTWYTWLIILITSFGILLSFTRMRQIENVGASNVGYAALYVFLASLGAQADLSGITSMPALLVLGVIWLLIHILFLIAGAKIIRAPMSLVAIGSMANIGGVVSTPVVAAAYMRKLMPVGLVLAVFGNIIGTYCALFTAYLLKLVDAW
jgi:uncharacterized membrane protein